MIHDDKRMNEVNGSVANAWWWPCAFSWANISAIISLSSISPPKRCSLPMLCVNCFSWIYSLDRNFTSSAFKSYNEFSLDKVGTHGRWSSWMTLSVRLPRLGYPIAVLSQSNTLWFSNPRGAASSRFASLHGAMRSPSQSLLPTGLFVPSNRLLHTRTDSSRFSRSSGFGTWWCSLW